MYVTYINILIGLLFTMSHVEFYQIDPKSSIDVIEVENLVLCQSIDTKDCSTLVDLMVKCQQIIFNDPGFSYQQYITNIETHTQMLAKYQIICEGVFNDK